MKLSPSSFRPTLALVCALSSALGAVACTNGSPGAGSSLYDGSEDPVAAGFTGSGDPTQTLESIEDETGNAALSINGQGAQAVSVSYAVADAAGSIGVRFRIRGSDPVVFSASVDATLPADMGGTCIENCWDLHKFPVSVTGDWQTITFTWDQLLQSGAHTPLDPATVRFLNWEIQSADAYNIWLDDIELLFEHPGDTTGHNPSVGTGGTTGEGTGGTTGEGTGGATTATGGGTATGTVTPSTNHLGKYVSKEMFDQGFSGPRNTTYTYTQLLAAVDKFPNFASCCNEDDKKREVAAFLANVQHESGGLTYVREINGKDHNYCNLGEIACPAGTYEYYGRGAMQLTWNYNYKFAQDYLNGTLGMSVDLLNSPDLVATDTELVWLTAMWFWMERETTAQAPHDVVISSGFGATIRNINGALECDKGYSIETDTNPVGQRVKYYREWCARLGVDPGANQGC